jgi:Thiamine pyrophosphate enzyme, C-terminal TPP binding domain
LTALNIAVVQVGMALNDKRVIASIGDGSFQVTAQDLSTMIREGELLHARACRSSQFPVPCDVGWFRILKQWTSGADLDAALLLLPGANPIIFLINNGGYTIEVEIHDGPYNVIHTWCDLHSQCYSPVSTSDCLKKMQEAVTVTLSARPHCRDYVALVKAIDNGIDRSWSTRVGQLASGSLRGRHYVVHPLPSKILKLCRRLMLKPHLLAVQNGVRAGCCHQDSDIREN